jgi:hypothetical protein
MWFPGRLEFGGFIIGILVIVLVVVFLMVIGGLSWALAADTGHKVMACAELTRSILRKSAMPRARLTESNSSN